MTSKAEFLQAQESLKQSAESKEDSDWGLYHTVLSQFDNINAWTLLNELIQNAVDANATDVTIKLHSDGLEFRHNGKEPLTRQSVEGLCAFSKSTKGLDSVGFMGIGFKSFIRFFHKVSIYDSGIKFAIDLRLKENGNPNLKDLHYPKWLEKEEVLPGETVFRFSNSHGGTMQTISNDLKNFDPVRLAVLGMRGLEQVLIDGDLFSINIIDNGVEILTESGQARRFTILEEEVEMRGEAISELKSVRDSSSKEDSTTRKVRLVKEYEIESVEKDEVLVTHFKPIEVHSGKIFCLVPLEGFSFPFKFGLDADWLLKPDRTALHSSGKHWHKEILNMIPKLIRRYIETMRDKISSEDWKEFLDIFPNDYYEVDPLLDHIGSEVFNKLMSQELGGLNFIHCRDGELRTPKDVRDFPERPDSWRGMKKATYKKLVESCCKSPVLNSDSISENSKKYLQVVSNDLFLRFPKNNEIDLEEVRSLWDVDDSKDYLHVLDIFNEIHTSLNSDGHGLELVPLQNSKWTYLNDLSLIFQPIPKSGRSKEKPLLDALKKSNPIVSLICEVHDEIKASGKSYLSPGEKWRESIEEAGDRQDIDIIDLITKLKISEQNTELVFAAYEFGLRTGQPEIVRFIHTDSGIVPCKDSFLGPPYENNEAILQLIDGKTQSGQMNAIAKKIKKNKQKTLDFLLKCGVQLFSPIISSKVSSDTELASKFIGKNVNPAWQPGKWRATWSGNKSGEGVQDAWTLNDYIWPLDFSDLDIDALSKLLSNPPKNLRSALNKAIKKRTMTWYYKKGKDDGEIKSMPCKWLTDLRETAWVKCTDGKHRRPRDAPIVSGDNPDIVSAEIDDKVVEFYSKLDIVFGSDLNGMSPSQRIEYWKSEKVTDTDFFISTLVESGLKDEELKNALLDSNFRTEGKEIAPIRRFISNPKSSLGGYFGAAENLPQGVIKFMAKNSIELLDSITSIMWEEYLNSFPSKPEKDYVKNLQHIQNAYSELILQEDLDKYNIKYRTINGKWLEPGEDQLYLQLTNDSFRLRDYNKQILDLRQFPTDVDLLRKIYDDDWPIMLIDNQFNLNQEVFENTESTVNMTRVVMSMNTSELGFEIKQIDGDLITVDFAGSSLNLPYCIQDYGSNFCIFLSRDTKSWAQSIANFLGDLLCAPSVTNDLIQALLYSDDDRFEDRYEQLCFEGKFNVTSHNDALEIVSFRSKILEQQDTNITNEPKIDRTPIIREPTKPVIREGEVKDKDSTKSKLKKEKISKNKSTKKLTVRKRNDAPSTKEIGDAGEEIVKIYLSKKGWKVQNRNEFYGMAVEGSDLIAEKDGKIRIIEVKSTNSNWDGNRSISWKQAVHALQYHDPENLHGRGHVTCWLYVVELVLGDEQPKIAEIDWCRAEPEFSFNPNEWAENFHHDEEE